MRTMHNPSNYWIWSSCKDEEEPYIVYFRKNMVLEEVPESFVIRISADTRYKLYINGRLCELGPAKGDRNIWFFDEPDVSGYLKKGKNVWAVEVLRYPADLRKGNMSLFRSVTPGLYIESLACDKAGIPVWKSDKTWKCRKLSEFQIISENPWFAPMQIYEERKADSEIFGWMDEEYLDESWENAVEYGAGEISANVSPGNLKKRDIPFMKKISQSFVGLSKVNESVYSREKWDKFLQENSLPEEKIVIPPETRQSVDIDAGELMTGFLLLQMAGGTGTKITLEQAECYVQKLPEKIASYDDLPEKGDRADAEHGILTGNRDTYMVGGFGTEKKPEIYEPFCFRTFRYIRMTVETGKEPLTLLKFNYLETGYPLDVRTKVKTSDSSLEKIWEISERTLKRCMHETYMDCPYYEQLQYVMDARSQILYTYAVSADDRLARRCLDDFRRSQRYNGLLCPSYPCTGNSVIPGFSIYYITMLYDHMMYFGDKKLIEDHMCTVDGILGYFRRHLDSHGLVEKVGDLNKPDRYWSFIDWTPEWRKTNGVPNATLQGPITMESLLYIMGLQYAAKLKRYIGREQDASMDEARAVQIQQAVNTWCRGKNGMYTDGTECEIYSQHCQVFAVLTDTVDRNQGREYLKETLEHKNDYAQCSVAMMYYLFRALEKCELYEYTDELWDVWRNMVKNHMTTCAEDPLESRSDCHAWGALALYELPSVILGVRPASPGYENITVNPIPGKLDWAKGEVITPKGKVKVSWVKKDGNMDVKYEIIKC